MKKNYRIVENLDDHTNYNGEPVEIVQELKNDFVVVRSTERNEAWFCGMEELQEIPE